jgi:tetratricopeptide (TPR) repeat protein
MRVPRARFATAWVATALAALTLFAFAPVASYGFVGLDDPANFLTNVDFRGLGWPQVGWAWRTHLLGVYQPLAWMLFEVEYEAWGLRPPGYHVTSLGLHAAAAAVLFVLTDALLARARPDLAACDRRFGAAAAAALFAVHPMRVEVVAWVSCQPYLPCALCAMGSVLAYLKAAGQPGRAGWAGLAASFTLYAAALLFKAAAVSLPAVLMILDVFPLRRLGGGPGRWLGPPARRVWLEKAPFVALGAAAAAAAVLARRGSEDLATVRPAGLSERVARACYSAAYYPVEAVALADTHPFAPLPLQVSLAGPVFALGAAAVLVFSVLAVACRRTRPGLAASWLAYLAVLAPGAGLVPVGRALTADRYSYLALASLSPALAAALGVLGLPRRGRPAASLGVLVLVPVLVVWLTLQTRALCRPWHDAGALRSFAVARFAERVGARPSSADARYHLGDALMHQGRFAEAAAQFREAARLDPTAADPHAALGACLSRSGRLDEARAEFARAVRREPASAGLRLSLGRLLADLGRPDEALPQLAEAARLAPAHPEPRYELGLVLAEQGRTDEALVQLAEAIRLGTGHALAHRLVARLRQLRSRPSRGGSPGPGPTPGAPGLF